MFKSRIIVLALIPAPQIQILVPSGGTPLDDAFAVGRPWPLHWLVALCVDCHRLTGDKFLIYGVPGPIDSKLNGELKRCWAGCPHTLKPSSCFLGGHNHPEHITCPCPAQMATPYQEICQQEAWSKLDKYLRIDWANQYTGQLKNQLTVDWFLSKHGVQPSKFELPNVVIEIASTAADTEIDKDGTSIKLQERILESQLGTEKEIRSQLAKILVTRCGLIDSDEQGDYYSAALQAVSPMDWGLRHG